MPRRTRQQLRVSANADKTSTGSSKAKEQPDGAVAEADADREDVALAELETIGSRVRRRAGPQYSAEDILLYDGDLIAFDKALSSTTACDPEVGYHLCEVIGIVPVEAYDKDPRGALVRCCHYFNEEVGQRGCLWMPLALSSPVHIWAKANKWVHVKATTGLKDDRIRVSWSEHKRIQTE